MGEIEILMINDRGMHRGDRKDARKGAQRDGNGEAAGDGTEGRVKKKTNQKIGPESGSNPTYRSR